ncbi:MAG: hypothetical protein JSU81_08400 [Candidatus Coatesbacteria bacterium]|nr:MAG: hypothetical protein JSU81_08400 [Candidatus Coatesbacteria bacterium]
MPTNSVIRGGDCNTKWAEALFLAGRAAAGILNFARLLAALRAAAGGRFVMNVYLRKSWHLLGLVLPAAYYFGALSRPTVLLIVAVITAGAVVLEILRFRFAVVARAFTAVFRVLMREEEFRRLNATIPFLGATFLTLLLFPRTLAFVAMAFLALGDAAAGIVGRRLGGFRLRADKTLAGTLACLAVCFVVGWYFVGWKLALVGAGVAAAAELLSPGWFDNFSVPLASGAAMWAVAHATGVNFPS